jgi:hypothetical protein
MTKLQANLQDSFMSKVVLLIGNDVSILHPLAVEFAKKGCDIVLASQKMSLELVNTIRDNVLSLGRRFLLLDTILTPYKMEVDLVEIKRELGGIDFLVDVTSRTDDWSSNLENRQDRLWLSRAILEEFTK